MPRWLPWWRNGATRRWRCTLVNRTRPWDARPRPSLYTEGSMEMFVSGFAKFWFVPLTVVCVALQVSGVQGQQRGGTPQTDKLPPVNSGANPYRVVRDWAQFTTEARPWGGSNGVAIDRDGRSVWATDRAHPGRRRAASAARETRCITSISQGRRSGALAAACSCGRTASMSIGMATCG